MPSLGADMETGTVARWLVQPGDPVHRGDIVASIETEKATIDAEVFEDGVIEALLVPEGDEVPVGTPLATIVPAGLARAPATAAEHVHSPLIRHLAASLGVELDGIQGSGPGGEITRADVEARAARPPLPAEAATTAAAAAATTAAAAAAGPEAAPGTPPQVPPKLPAAGRRAGRAGAHVRAAPYVRRRARELGIDLTTLEATGPGGTVTLADLAQPAGPTQPTAPSHGDGRPAAAGRRHRARTVEEQRQAMREQTAALMARSKREIPHYYLTSTVELRATLELLAERNTDRPPERRVLPVAALLKATALATAEVPEMNGTYLDGTFRASAAVHLGVAIALRQGGLVAPVLRNLEQQSTDEVMAALRDLVARARAGRLRSSEVSEATMTVTSLGDLGADLVLGVIYPPQVALVGFGTIAERPVALDGLVGARPTVTVSLAADHRVSDGHLGARFLRTIGRILHEGEGL